MPTDYLAGKNTVVTINSTIRGFTDGTYTTATETDDMTNTEEGAYGRDIGTVKRCTINGTIAFRSSAPLDFDEDDEVEVEIVNTGGPGLEGTFLVVSMSNPSISPRSGVKIGVEMRSQGLYTKTGGAVGVAMSRASKASAKEKEKVPAKAKEKEKVPAKAQEQVA